MLCGHGTRRAGAALTPLIGASDPMTLGFRRLTLLLGFDLPTSLSAPKTQ